MAINMFVHEHGREMFSMRVNDSMQLLALADAAVDRGYNVFYDYFPEHVTA